MLTIELPSMVAGRALADALVDRLEGDLGGAVVVLDCRRLLSGSPSFAAQVVSRVLVHGGAAELRVQGATAAFADELRDAAGRQGVGGRLSVHDTQPAGV